MRTTPCVKSIFSFSETVNRNVFNQMSSICKSLLSNLDFGSVGFPWTCRRALGGAYVFGPALGRLFHLCFDGFAVVKSHEQYDCQHTIMIQMDRKKMRRRKHTVSFSVQ